MTMNANQPTENVTPAPVGSGHLVRRLEAHAQTLAEILAECAGYLASVRTDRQIVHHEELFALQTVEWAEGAVEIAEKANAALEAHDDIRCDVDWAEVDAMTPEQVDALLVAHGYNLDELNARIAETKIKLEERFRSPPNNPAQTPEGRSPGGCL